MSALEELARAKTALRTELLRKRPPGRLSEDRADEFINEFQAALKNTYAHQLAEDIRTAASDEAGPAMKWNWWDPATIPASCADLIDPEVER